MRRAAVCFLGMGAPSGSEDVRGYLYRIFSDRHIIPLPAAVRVPLAWFLARRLRRKSISKYEAIGGLSPFTAQTRVQCDRIAAALEARGLPVPVAPAMRYASPTIEEAVEWCRVRGVTEVVGLPQYPQYSTTTTASCAEALTRACAAHGMRVLQIREYPALPGLIAAWADALRASLPAENGNGGTHVLFLAHSIPLRCVRRGDPYPRHVAQTAEGILAALGRPVAWSIAYQSRTARGAWLSPSAEGAVVDIVRRGVKHLVVVPVSFLTENLETLYDIDACLAHIAAGVGPSRFVRVPVPHQAPALLEGLAGLVERALAR